MTAKYLEAAKHRDSSSSSSAAAASRAPTLAADRRRGQMSFERENGVLEAEGSERNYGAADEKEKTDVSPGEPGFGRCWYGGDEA